MIKTPDPEFRLVPVAELAPPERGSMYQLLAEHFTGVTTAQFARDLGEKQLALLLTRGDVLAGFSTLRAFTTRHDGEQISIIYSGDTIVAPEAWGTMALPRAWVAGVETLRATLPPGRCFWLLLTSGFRTYRFLPVFWREFFPRFDTPTPLDFQRLITHIGREQFGARFDATNGIVRFAQPQKLRTRLAAVAPGRLKDPHIAFFLTRNPGHLEGDELVCLTELSAENLSPAGRRMMTPRVCASHGHHC